MATTVKLGPRLQVGFADQGCVMNDAPGVAFRSVEAGGDSYEHFAIGDPEEGYSLFYMTSPGAGDIPAHDVFSTQPGDLVNITHVSHRNLRNDALELVTNTLSRTSDNMMEVNQMLTFAADATRVSIRMEITNISKNDLVDILIKRYCDIDVDTGGPNGWANFQNHWSKDRDSIHAWNQPSEVVKPGKHAHIVNMVAMPSDLPLDQTFIGFMGRDQFKLRANQFPILSSVQRVDGVGILQWQATRLRSGESVRLNLYYDAFCLCSDLPLTFEHNPATVRATDIAVPGASKPRTQVIQGKD